MRSLKRWLLSNPSIWPYDTRLSLIKTFGPLFLASVPAGYFWGLEAGLTVFALVALATAVVIWAISL